jgi:hypothetical protein
MDGHTSATQNPWEIRKPHMTNVLNSRLARVVGAFGTSWWALLVLLAGLYGLCALYSVGETISPATIGLRDKTCETLHVIPKNGVCLVQARLSGTLHGFDATLLDGTDRTLAIPEHAIIEYQGGALRNRVPPWLFYVAILLLTTPCVVALLRSVTPRRNGN